MDAEERAGGRRKIIATAIEWGMEPRTCGRPYDPRLIRLLMDARSYGLPPLLPGQTEFQWAFSVRNAVRAENGVVGRAAAMAQGPGGDGGDAGAGLDDLHLEGGW